MSFSKVYGKYRNFYLILFVYDSILIYGNKDRRISGLTITLPTIRSSEAIPNNSLVN